MPILPVGVAHSVDVALHTANNIYDVFFVHEMALYFGQLFFFERDVAY